MDNVFQKTVFAFLSVPPDTNGKLKRQISKSPDSVPNHSSTKIGSSKFAAIRSIERRLIRESISFFLLKNEANLLGKLCGQNGCNQRARRGPQLKTSHGPTQQGPSLTRMAADRRRSQLDLSSKGSAIRKLKTRS